MDVEGFERRSVKQRIDGQGSPDASGAFISTSPGDRFNRILIGPVGRGRGHMGATAAEVRLYR